MRSNFQQIILYCLGICKQNPGLREVDLEPSPNRGSDKIKTQKQGRNTQKKGSCIVKNSITFKFQFAAYFMFILDYHLPAVAARKGAPYKEILSTTSI